MSDQEKPARLYFKTYLKAIDNSVGTNIFRNLYVKTSGEGEFDAMQDGVLSCAFFVSGLLTMFGKISAIHGTVTSTVKDLEKSGWVKLEEPKAGDVLVWEKALIEGDLVDHIGFYIGDGKAISNSYKDKTPRMHDYDFGGTRKIIAHYRMNNWQDDDA